MINKLLTFILCFTVSTVAFSQTTKTTLSLLQAKQWKMRLKNNYVYFDIYEDNGKLLSRSGDELKERTYSYYLSNAIDTVFDEKKMGKSENGKYIICLFSNDKKMPSVFEIITLNDSYMALKHLRYCIIEEFDAK